MTYCKSQIRLNSICPVVGAKMTKGVNIIRERKMVYPQYNPQYNPLIYTPLIQPSLKIQPMTQYQVYGFRGFTIKSLTTTNCYNS